MNDYQKFITEQAKNLVPMDVKEFIQYVLKNFNKTTVFAESFNERTNEGEGWFGFAITKGCFDNMVAEIDMYGGGSYKGVGIFGIQNEYGDLVGLHKEDVEYITDMLDLYFDLYGLGTVYVETKK